MHLEYKGLKSTRMQATIVAWLMGTIFLAAGTITSAEWIHLTEWVLGIYAGSEVGSKGAVAIAERKP